MEPCGLPGDANLEHLRKIAKELQRRSRAGDSNFRVVPLSINPRVRRALVFFSGVHPFRFRFTLLDSSQILQISDWQRLTGRVSSI